MADEQHYDRRNPDVRVDHGGWISGPCASDKAAAALEMERAIAKAGEVLGQLDNLMASKGCPYTLGRIETMLKRLMTAAEAIL